MSVKSGMEHFIQVRPCKIHTPVTEFTDKGFHHFPRMCEKYTNHSTYTQNFRAKHSKKEVDLNKLTYSARGRFIRAREIFKSSNTMKKPSCVIDGVPMPMHLSTVESPLQNEPMYEFPVMHDICNELYDMDSIVKQLPITKDCPVAYQEEGTGFVKCTEPDNLDYKVDRAFGHIVRRSRGVFPKPSPAARYPIIQMRSKHSKGAPRATLFVVVHDTMTKAYQATSRFLRNRNYNIVKLT